MPSDGGVSIPDGCWRSYVLHKSEADLKAMQTGLQDVAPGRPPLGVRCWVPRNSNGWQANLAGLAKSLVTGCAGSAIAFGQRKAVRTTLNAEDYVTRKDAKIETLASFSVKAGRAVVEPGRCGG